MPMRIILRADVDNLGHLGEIVSVKPGYGRNYLIPKGLAMLATPTNRRVFELERKKLQDKMDAARSKAQNLVNKITSVEIIIPMRVGESDKLYGSVTRSSIADALVKLMPDEAANFDRRKIQLEAPIRALGFYEVVFKLYADVHALLHVRVVRHNVHHIIPTEVALAAEVGT
ncbi:50S ribosomal protein L9 [Desulfovibrionales bacterium]